MIWLCLSDLTRSSSSSFLFGLWLESFRVLSKAELPLLHVKCFFPVSKSLVDPEACR